MILNLRIQILRESPLSARCPAPTMKGLPPETTSRACGVLLLLLLALAAGAEGGAALRPPRPCLTAECPCLDSLHYSLLGGLLGGESGGRSIGSPRVAGGQARW